MRNQVAPCGTIAGFARHKKHNQEICGPCRRANQEYMIEYNVMRKIKRAKQTEYLKREREATLQRAMQAMEVVALGKKTSSQI